MAVSRITRSSSRPNSSLELPVTALPGIGDDSAKLLERIEIRTIGQLLWHLPRTYADFSKFTPLKSVRAEQEHRRRWSADENEPEE